MTERPDRGQAITLNYTLGLAISTVLVTGLLIAGAGFVQDQRERAARAELEVVGQQVAADIEAADRLAVAGDSDVTATLSRTLPRSVAGSSYDVEVVAQSEPYIRLWTTNPDVEVRVEFTNRTDVAQSRFSGGQVAVNYTDGAIAVEQGDI